MVSVRGCCNCCLRVIKLSSSFSSSVSTGPLLPGGSLSRGSILVLRQCGTKGLGKLHLWFQSGGVERGFGKR